MIPCRSAVPTASTDDVLAAFPPELTPELDRLCAALCRCALSWHRRNQTRPVPILVAVQKAEKSVAA